MNFFRGAITRRSNSLWFVEARTDGTTGFAVSLPESIWNNLTSYVDRNVAFGSRPEDVSVRPWTDASADSGVSAAVEVIEPMGAETYLYLNTGAHSLIARVPPHERPAIGQRLGIMFDMRKCHFFDTATEITIV
jgi:multiple sugar transport system ATP-binding protein